MRISSQCGRRRSRPGCRHGFTLVELLIVVVIIGLLVAILTPAVITAMKIATASKTRIRITQLVQAAELFYKDKNRGYYPGQGEELLEGLTGSQKLAKDLWGPDLDAPKLKYTSCVLDRDARKSDLFDPREISINYATESCPNSISDRYDPRPMAILYFPARTGKTGIDQYVKEDNEKYLVDNGNP
ncbi:MAG: type II secretion system protein, partial [Planctomycetota bacterium]